MLIFAFFLFLVDLKFPWVLNLETIETVFSGYCQYNERPAAVSIVDSSKVEILNSIAAHLSAKKQKSLTDDEVITIL